MTAASAIHSLSLAPIARRQQLGRIANPQRERSCAPALARPLVRVRQRTDDEYQKAEHVRHRT